jgi:uncharacterized double-CXXCG motif protein
MPRFFEVREDKASRRTGFVDGTHRWSLPGVQCPVCGVGWSGIGEDYPSVDLSQHRERAAFEDSESDSIAEFERLREVVRPLAPEGALLEPGAGFGPIRGTVSGNFGDFHLPMPWMLMAKPETLEKLRAEGVRGLRGFPMELDHRGKKPPALLDVELQTHGRLHPVCFPESWKASCRRCGRNGNTLPDALVLDAATLPVDMDVFRLRDHPTVIIASERFVNAVGRLGLDEIVFKELPVR